MGRPKKCQKWLIWHGIAPISYSYSQSTGYHSYMSHLTTKLFVDHVYAVLLIQDCLRSNRIHVERRRILNLHAWLSLRAAGGSTRHVLKIACRLKAIGPFKYYVKQMGLGGVKFSGKNPLQGSTLAVFRYPEHPRFSDGLPDTPEQ